MVTVFVLVGAAACIGTCFWAASGPSKVVYNDGEEDIHYTVNVPHNNKGRGGYGTGGTLKKGEAQKLPKNAEIKVFSKKGKEISFKEKRIK